MQNISEFRMVHGVTAAIYQVLLPNIAALPEVTAININTAPKAVLMSLGNGLNKSQVDELLLARKEEGGINTATMVQLMKKLNIPTEQVTVDSNYFLNISTTSTNDNHLTVYTVLKRVRNRRGESVISIVSESLNAP